MIPGQKTPEPRHARSLVSPAGNLNIVQKGKLSPRGTGDSRVTVQDGMVLGLKCRQVSLWPSQAKSMQGPKVQHSRACPPSPTQ